MLVVKNLKYLEALFKINSTWPKQIEISVFLIISSYIQEHLFESLKPVEEI